jgi:hypothetical protein
MVALDRVAFYAVLEILACEAGTNHRTQLACSTIGIGQQYQPGKATPHAGTDTARSEGADARRAMQARLRAREGSATNNAAREAPADAGGQHTTSNSQPVPNQS